VATPGRKLDPYMIMLFDSNHCNCLLSSHVGHVYTLQVATKDDGCIARALDGGMILVNLSAINYPSSRAIVSICGVMRPSGDL